MYIIKKCLFILFPLILIGSGGFAQDMNSEKTPAAVDSGYIDVDGGKLFYEATGQGDVMVMIHDGLVHRVGWDHQFKYFSSTNRCVRYDRRGFGRSPKAEVQYSDIEDLNRVFETLGIEKAALMGSSAGSRLAIDFTLKYPEKVAMLVLSGPVVSGLPFTNHFYTRGGHRGTDIVAGSEKYLDYWVDDDPYEMWSGSTDAKKWVKEILHANPHNAVPVDNRYYKGPERPAIKFLNEIKVPAIIIVGEDDIPDVHAHAGAIEAGIPNAKRVIVNNAGHLVAMEQPDIFNNLIVTTIAELKFDDILNTKGARAAAAAYREARTRGEKSLSFAENSLNNLGLELSVARRKVDGKKERPQCP